jgi:FkbM family methyltransferase
MQMNFSPELRFDPEEGAAIMHLLEAALVATREHLQGGGGDRPGRAPRWVHRHLARVRLGLSRRGTEGDAVRSFSLQAADLTGHPLALKEEGGFVRWIAGDETWMYPASPEKLFFFGFLTAVGPARWLGAKYTLPGFVELDPEDVVIDCGAFVGGFARAAIDAGAALIAVEPSRTNQVCLRANLPEDAARLEFVGLGASAVHEARFTESSTGLDSTFGKMDEGHATAGYGVDILTIDELCLRSEVKPTFLKIEAEGMESSILQGMKEIRPAKVAVDGSPEGGSDDRARIEGQLESLGYEVRTDQNMIYARLPTSA